METTSETPAATPADDVPMMTTPARTAYAAVLAVALTMSALSRARDVSAWVPVVAFVVDAVMIASLVVWSRRHARRLPGGTAARTRSWDELPDLRRRQLRRSFILSGLLVVLMTALGAALAVEGQWARAIVPFLIALCFVALPVAAWLLARRTSEARERLERAYTPAPAGQRWLWLGVLALGLVVATVVLRSVDPLGPALAIAFVACFVGALVSMNGLAAAQRRAQAARASEPGPSS